MNDKTASSKALGFGVFAVASWMFSMIDAGWFLPAAYNSGTAHTVLMFALIGLLIAAIAAFRRGETWFAFFFMFWSAIAWGYSQGTGGAEVTMAFSGWFHLAIALVSLYLWVAAMRGGLGGAISWVALLTGLSWAAAGIAAFASAYILQRIDGYLGLAAALIAFYVSAAEIVNSEAGKEVLPFASAGKSRSASEGM